MAKKKNSEKFVCHIHAVNLKIVRQLGNNNLYATWSFTETQKKTKITKRNVYGKKKKAWGKKYPSLIDFYEIQWLYQVPGSRTWFLDKTIATSSRDTKADLYSPPANASNVQVKVRVHPKTYKNTKKKQSKWFSVTKWTVRSDGDYNEVPATPSVSDFTITGKTLKASVSVEVDADSIQEIDKIQFQVLMNASTIKHDEIVDVNNSTGIATLTKELKDVGTYQVRARSITYDKGNTKATLYSAWSSWSSSIDTRPSPPTGLKVEALDEEKIKVTWNKVPNVIQYQIEYVSDNASYFDSGMVSSVTVEDVNTYIINGLEAGHTWYFRIRSVNGSDKSDPSGIVEAILAIKPSPPTTWSSTTTAVIASTLDTTEPVYIYYTHNTQDNSVQESAKLQFDIGGTTYYLTKANDKKNEYGELIDEISALSLWDLTVYTNEANTVSAGTIYDIFSNSTSETIKWKARTKGAHASYSDFSIERAIKAYMQPSLSLSVTDSENNLLIGDVLTSFPLVIKGQTSPSTQTPISYYLSITADSSYETNDIYGNEMTVAEGAEIYSLYLDTNEQLNKELTAAEIDFVTNVTYTLKVVAYMDSGLTADASYGFGVSWDEIGTSPELDIDFDEDYRYTTIRPYCTYYIGANENDDVVLDPNYEPVAYMGTAISGQNEIGTAYGVFGNVGDMYFNNETFEAYTCVYSGDADTTLWLYRTTFDYSDSQTWYEGTVINSDADDDIYKESDIEDAKINDYYFSKPSGDIYRCMKSGNPSQAVWQYLWNVFWAVSPDILLSVYRMEANGSYVTICENIDNSVQNTDEALYFRDPHPNFKSCTYRVVSTNKENGGTAFNDFVEEYDETSVIIQWDEKWSEDVLVANDETFSGRILELPYNVKLSDSTSQDVELVNYIGRYRPVSYYGTQRGESASISCEFPKNDTSTLDLLRRLMIYQGDVYVREPSGLGYWANVTVSYNRDYSTLVIPVTINITPVEGGA